MAIAQSLRADGSVTFYRKPRQYAPAFYTQGRVLAGNGKADILDIETARDMEALLRAQTSATSSLIVITSPAGEGGLKRDARFLIAPIARQEDVSAWRLSLRRAK